MIGLDTNVLLRFFDAKSNPPQTAAARHFVSEQGPVFLNPIVLVEFAWTLRTTFKLDHATVHDRLAMIIDAPEFVVAFPQATRRAVEEYGKGPADFADYLIGELNSELGCEVSVTFDQNAAKSAAFRQLAI
jgi:predicted nucleic-acid-binding protein